MAKAVPLPASTSEVDAAHARAFEDHRSALFGLAYRILGSVADAEDAVQDCYLRWRRADPAEIVSPRAWLMTATSRLCIDRLRAAKARRETYIGPWLPEPLVTDTDPDETGALASSLSMAMLLLLERLGPAERAAFLLRDVFECDYAEIAQALQRNEAACRQMVHRARARIASSERRFEADADTHRSLLAAFGTAVEQGDVAGLKAMLAEQAQAWTDGGGRVLAARNVIHGADAVARFLVGIWRKREHAYVLEPRVVNGGPGLVGWFEGKVAFVLSLDVSADRIHAVHMVSNPDKLHHVHDAHRNVH